jgi:Tir chaperone protein (CesT) family
MGVLQVRDVRDALEALKDIVGAPALEFDGQGRAELVIEDRISIYLFRISDRDLELTAYTTTIDRHVSFEQLNALLRLNSISNGLRQARFALDARGVPFLGQRINVHLVDREALDRLVLGFVQCVMTYRDADLTHLTDPGSPVRSEELPKDGDSGSFIRV